jgi:CopG family nickel-responsive transcriptional regulator
MPEELKRFGVSMEEGLLERFDGFIRDHAYTNRSEAIRDLVRKALVAEEWAHDRETVGAITIVYDHHVPELPGKLNRHQHDFGGQVVASLHVHLDHNHCMEVVVAKGKAQDIKALSDRLIALRGVLHGTLTGSTVGSPFRPGDRSGHSGGKPRPHSHEH